MPKKSKSRKKKFSRSYKKEFKKQLRLAIAAAIGFTIAFSWRNVIFDSVHSLVQNIDKKTTVFQTQFTASLIITVVGVLFILLFSKLLKEK
ncbi:MAG: hypothetical protein KKF56_01185 [Nanoarchaeota archaeon]|nr:hypothetical protein [Nanoarchaeota archaeon]